MTMTGQFQAGRDNLAHVQEIAAVEGWTHCDINYPGGVLPWLIHRQEVWMRCLGRNP